MSTKTQTKFTLYGERKQQVGKLFVKSDKKWQSDQVSFTILIAEIKGTNHTMFSPSVMTFAALLCILWFVDENTSKY